MLDHVGIRVSDFEQSKRFFAEALSPLGYELIMEPSVSAAGFGRRGKPDSGSAKVILASPSTSRLPPRTAPAWMPSTRRHSQRADATTEVPGFALSTIRATMRPLSSILMATTSKRSAMSQEKNPKPSSSYSPECVEVEFSKVQIQDRV